MNSIERLAYFIREREAVRVFKAAGKPKPWTGDPILQKYRFCNVRREDDAVTRWIAQYWRQPNQLNPDLWFAMVVARHVNLPATLQELGFPVPWDGNHFTRVMAARKKRKLLSYNSAYMIRANSGVPGQSKATYLRHSVFDPMWEQRERLRPREGDTLNSWHMLLGQFYGLGSFMAGQVVADMKYTYPLTAAEDWWTFACSGPGSRRGLNFVLDRPMDSHWTEEEWRFELERTLAQIAPLIDGSVGRLHAQDFQNCLCEYSKYRKVQLGLGRPKSLYPGEA